MKLVEIECDREAFFDRPPARIRLNGWQHSDGTFSIVGGEGRKALPADEWLGFRNAVLIGEIDESRVMEADRIVYEYPAPLEDFME